MLNGSSFNNTLLPFFSDYSVFSLTKLIQKIVYTKYIHSLIAIFTLKCTLKSKKSPKTCGKRCKIDVNVWLTWSLHKLTKPAFSQINWGTNVETIIPQFLKILIRINLYHLFQSLSHYLMLSQNCAQWCCKFSLEMMYALRVSRSLLTRLQIRRCAQHHVWNLIPEGLKNYLHILFSWFICIK